MVIPIIQTGDPVLRRRSRELSVDEIGNAEIQELIVQMRETMRTAPGVGLAAPQVGRLIRLVVIEDAQELHTNLSREQLEQQERIPVPFHVLINPEITVETQETVEFFEGCLSVAGFAALTPRYRVVHVSALDEHGELVSRRASGWYARILQHEIDHLNGVLYIDRMISRSFTTMENKNSFLRNATIEEMRAMLRIEGSA